MDGTQLLIYFYISVHVYILPYFLWSKMITFLGSLLQCIVLDNYFVQILF